MRTETNLFLVICILTTVNSELQGLRFFLYTKSNIDSPVELKADDISGILSSPLMPNKPVKILCHGVFSNFKFDFPETMKNKYLQQPEDINIIVMDWLELNWPLVTLDEAILNAKPIGREAGMLINTIIFSGKSKIKDFHFIGHSLGAQIGSFISTELDERISRITGIDAVIPGFNITTSPLERLDPTDADFVDIIHSSPGGIDFSLQRPNEPNAPGMGTVDFYPNGGYMQPACPLDMMYLCSHLMAYRYFTESIDRNVHFVAYKCDSYESYKDNCPRKHPALMGEYVNKSISGAYYLDTKMVSPFAVGMGKYKDNRNQFIGQFSSWLYDLFTNVLPMNYKGMVRTGRRLMGVLTNNY